MMNNQATIDIFIPIKGKTGQNASVKRKFISDFLQISNITKYKTREFNLYANIVFHFTQKCNGDIDNLIKSLFDSIQKAGIIKNDKQIKKMYIEIQENSLIEGISLKLVKLSSQ